MHEMNVLNLTFESKRQAIEFRDTDRHQIMFVLNLDWCTLSMNCKEHVLLNEYGHSEKICSPDL